MSINISSLIAQTFSNGDPMKPMLENTSATSLAELSEYSQSDIVATAWGQDMVDILFKGDTLQADNPVVRDLFLLYSKIVCKNLDLLQNPENYGIPIKARQLYCCPNRRAISQEGCTEYSMSSGQFPGASLFKVLGRIFVPKGEDARFLQQSAKEKISDEEFLYLVKDILPEDAIIFDQSSPNKGWLTPILGVCLEFEETMETLFQIQEILERNGARGYMTVTEDTLFGDECFALNFEHSKAEGFRRIIIHPTKGVYEASRTRRFNHLVVVSKYREDFFHLNSYSTFICWLFRFCSHFISQGGSNRATKEFGLMFDKYLVSEERTGAPLTSYDEQGAPDGDRQALEESSAQTRTYCDDDTHGVWFPFKITPSVTAQQEWVFSIGTQDTDTMVKAVGYNPFKTNPLVDEAVFHKFNLVRMVTSGAFIDGRITVLRMKDVPAEHKLWLLKKIEEQVGNWHDWNAKEKVTGLSGNNLMEWLGEELTLTLSSKATKFVKRTTMDKAVISRLVDGETRYSINWGQLEASANNLLVPACISLGLIGAAGNAYYWEDLGTAVVQKRTKSNPEIQPILEKGAIKFETSGAYSQRVENGWTILDYSNFVVDIHEVVISFPYKEAGGLYLYEVKSQYQDAEIVEVRFRVANNVGSTMCLNVEVTYVNKETAIKARNYVKAVMTPYRANVLSNGLNKDFYAKALFPADTNKFADLVKGHFDVIAATYIKNCDNPKAQAGYQLVRELNKAVGCSKYTDAVWSPLAAWTGLYKKLHDQFDADFGKAMWATWSEEQADWTYIMSRLMMSENGVVRNGWARTTIDEIPELLVIHSHLDPETVLIFKDGEVSNPKTNIVVIGKAKNGNYVFIQRAWSWVGTQDCPVYQPIKCEVSTVTENIGYSEVMMGVIRNIGRKCIKTARTLANLGDRRLQLSAALHLMAKGRSDSNSEVVTLFSKDQLTEEAKAILHAASFQEIVSNPDNNGRMLKLMAEHLAGQFFLVEFNTLSGGKKVFSLNLAAIAAQDANTEFASEDSLSALVEQMFLAMARCGKASPTRAFALAIRIHSKLVKLAENEGVNKAAAFGARNLGARAVGVPGIPTEEIWLPVSGDPRSVYQKWIRGFGNIHKHLEAGAGCKVACSRAPMVEPIYQRIVVIGTNDPRHKYLSQYTWNMNVIVNNIHGGDYDGDTYTVIPLVYFEDGKFHESDIELTSVYDVVDIVKQRTGSDQFVDDSGNAGGSYYADHNEIKLKKLGISSKNLVPASTVADNLMYATECQFQLVGQIHTLTLISDLYVNLMQDIKAFGLELTNLKVENKKPVIEVKKESDTLAYYEEKSVEFYQTVGVENFWELANLIMTMYEIYEVPLGGYDFAAYTALTIMLDISSTGFIDEDTLHKLERYTSMAGMNSQLLYPIVALCQNLFVTKAWQVRYYKKNGSEKHFAVADRESFIKSPNDFVTASVVMNYRISKGTLVPAKNQSGAKNSSWCLVEDWVGYVLAHPDLVSNLQNSMVLLPIRRFVKTVYSAIAGLKFELDIDSLLGKTNSHNQPEEDQDTNDGGGSPVPTPPNNDNDGGDQLAAEKVEEKVAQEVTALNTDNYSFSGLSSIWDWFCGLPQSVQSLKDWSNLSEDQAIAVHRVCCGDYNAVTVLGRAGSGKTFTMKFIQEVLGMMGVEVYICGSTGAANANANGNGTFNSLFGLGIGNVLPSNTKETLPPSCDDKRRRDINSAAQQMRKFVKNSPGPDVVFLIDECSMLSSELLVLGYQSAMRAIGLNRAVRFGLFGDMRQLEFITGDNNNQLIQTHANHCFKRARFTLYNYKEEIKTTTLEYGSLLTNEGPFLIGGSKKPWSATSISLVTNHRQKTEDKAGADFVDALNALGDGKDFNDPKVQPLLGRVFSLREDGTYCNVLTHEAAPTNLDNGLHLYTHNKEIEIHNKKIINKDMLAKPACRTYRAFVQGIVMSKDQVLKEVRPIPREQTVYVGQRVMYRKNTQFPGLVNGSICEVTRIAKDNIGLKVLSTGEEYTVGDMDFPISETKMGAGGIFRTPALFHGAYAMTPWKVQGATVKQGKGSSNKDAVVINLRRSERVHGLLYVSCSRVESPDQLFILVDNLNHLNNSVYCNPDIAEFIQLAERNTQSILEGGIPESEVDPNVPVVDAAQISSKSGNAVCRVLYQNNTYAVLYKPIGGAKCQLAGIKMFYNDSWVDLNAEEFGDLYTLLTDASGQTAYDLLNA